MVDWGAERFGEWWEAHKRYRRTRSYGVLFSVAAFWWPRLSIERRQSMLKKIGATPHIASVAWDELVLGSKEAPALSPGTLALINDGVIEQPKQRSQHSERRAKLAQLVEDEFNQPIGRTVTRGRVWWDQRGKCYAVEFAPPRAVVDLIQGDKSERGPPAPDPNSAQNMSRPPPARRQAVG